MSIVLPELPGILNSLDEHEEKFQGESIVLVRGDKETSEELDLIEGTLGAVFSVVNGEKQASADLLAIQMLDARLFNSVARLFNSVAVSLKLMLRGYYQVSFAIQRDLVEIAFLLSYFGYKPEMVSKWRNCSEKEQKRLFRPARIREALDKRNGLKNQKRDKLYQAFCELAAHPTYPGMRLLAPKGSVKPGPFLDRKFLRQCLWELSRFATYAAMQLLVLLPADQLSTLQTHSAFLDKARDWWKLQATKKRMPP